MKGGKDEARPMDPLFPWLHISDADKGGPRAPPRNKMALCEQYRVPSQGSKIWSGSVPLLPSNDCSSFALQASSINVVSDKGKVRPSSGSMPGSSHLTERYYSHCHGGEVSNTSLTTSERRISGPENYQNLRASVNLTTKAKCSLVQPNGLSGYNNCYTQHAGDENNFKVPYFLQSGKTLNCGNFQLHPSEGKIASCSSVSSELHNVCLKPLEVMRSGDRTTEHCRNPTERGSKLSQVSESYSEKPLLISSIGEKNSAYTSLAGNKFSNLDIRELQPNQDKKSRLGDVQSTICDPYAQQHQECKILQKTRTFTNGIPGMHETATRKRRASEIEDSLYSSPRPGESNERTRFNLIEECSKDAECEALPIGNADKKHNLLDTALDGSVTDQDLTPDDVVRVIGQSLFWKARKRIIHQQRIFSLQIFELHRLIKVQRLMAGSPKMLHEINFHPSKPSIQFPPINKLLYVTPLDLLPAVAKTKVDAQMSNTDKDCGADAITAMTPLPTSNSEKGCLVQQLTAKPLPTPPTIPIDTKLAPVPIPASIPTDAKPEHWYFHPPPGNQWLVPVKSPSEGFIYKPYMGPCFPTLGFMAPVYGNCGPVSLNTVGGTTHGVLAPNDHGVGPFYGTALGQKYFQPNGMPLINASGSNLEVRQMVSLSGFHFAEVDKNLSAGNANFAMTCQSLCKVSSQQSAVVNDCGGNFSPWPKGSDWQGSRPSSPAERFEGEALSLFPTTPSCQVLDDQTRVQVIKVVPHNRQSAPESAARIFQSIQDERKKT